MQFSKKSTALIILALSVLALFLSYKLLFGQNTFLRQKFFNTKSFNVLVLGVDSLFPGKLSGWRGRSDVMIVLSYNAPSNKLSLLSIPRDTYVDFKKYDFHKINSANQVGGYRLSKWMVEKLLGIEINHILVLNLQGFINITQEIGPFKIFVPNKMQYEDLSADLHIKIEPGLQELSGIELVNYLRYRDATNGDIGRINRQQIFFRAIMQRLFEQEVIFKIPSILLNSRKLFKTDMDFTELFELGVFFRDTNFNSIKSYIIPGNFAKNGYWRVNQVKLKALIAALTTKENESKDTQD